MCEKSMVGKLQHGVLNRCVNQAFFNYFHSQVLFLIFVHVCVTFRRYFWKYVITIEYLCKYWNHCLFSLTGNIFLFLFRTYLENTGRHIILCVKMLLLKKSRMCYFRWYYSKFKCKAQENKWQIIMKNAVMI